MHRVFVSSGTCVVNALSLRDDGFTRHAAREKGEDDRRLDFTWASENLYNAAHDCAAQRDFEPACRKEDNLPAIVDFVGNAEAAAQTVNIIAYDAAKPRDPAEPRRFSETTGRNALPPWGTNINDNFKETADALFKSASSLSGDSYCTA